MAFPAAPTEAGGSKLHFLTNDGNTALGWFGVTEGVTATGANNVGFAAVATHINGDTASTPGGLDTTSTDVPVLLGAGLDGTTVRAVKVDASGELQVDVLNTVTVGTHAVTQSGPWNIGTVTTVTTVSAVTAISNALPAGTNLLGGILDDGWDNAAKAVQRGLAQSITVTSEQTLLAADASNLYNIHQIVLTFYSGSTAPGGMRTIKFRLGAAGTVFHTEYVPPTASIIESRVIPFPKLAVRSATNQAITVQLDAALGSLGEYSAMVLAYKSAS